MFGHVPLSKALRAVFFLSSPKQEKCFAEIRDLSSCKLGALCRYMFGIYMDALLFATSHESLAPTMISNYEASNLEERKNDRSIKTVCSV